MPGRELPLVGLTRPAILIGRRCGGARHAPSAGSHCRVELKASQVKVVGGRPCCLQSEAIPAVLDGPHQVGPRRRALPDVGPRSRSTSRRGAAGISSRSRWRTPGSVGSRASVTICASSFLMVVFSARLPNFRRGSRRLRSSTKPVACKNRPPFLPLCPGPGDDDDGLAVGVDFLDGPGQVFCRVLGEVAPLSKPGETLLSHPSASAVDLPRKGRPQLPELSRM